MKKFLVCLFIVLMICLICLPVSPAYATDDVITFNVSIYTNGELVATDVKQETGIWDFPIDYYYGDLYGDFSSSACSINGTPGICFCFDGANITVLSSTYESPNFGDIVNLSIYYTKPVDVEPEPEPEYGGITLNLHNPDEVEYTDPVFTGVKGADQKTFSASFTNNILTTSVDVSYNWTYTFNGINYNVDSFPYTNDLSLEKHAKEQFEDNK